MKRAFIFLGLVGIAAGIAWAAPRIVIYRDVIGPTYTKLTGGAGNGVTTITIAAPPVVSGLPYARNCIDDLNINVNISTTPISFQTNLVDGVGGTTFYSVYTGTSTALSKYWPEGDAECASPNNPILLTIQDTAPGSSIYDVSYKGYTYASGITQ